MNASHRATAVAFLLALAHVAHAAQSPQQPEPQRRRPQGPAAGPVIKLPQGVGAAEERLQTAGTKEEAAREPAAPPKWEYCVISDFRSQQRGFPSSARVTVALVRYLPEGSEEFEGVNEEEALNKALAKLGEDGWELAAVRTDLQLEDGDGRTRSVYFLKRPKRQE